MSYDLRGAPRVSVVLPVKDGAATLPLALDSLRAQTFDGFEVLVVDDGSRDDGPALARAVCDVDARFRLLASPGRGLVAALQAGIAGSRAPLVARMDADDVAHPERFAAQVAALDADPSIALLGTAVEVVGAGEGLRRYVAWQNALVTPADHARELFVEAPLCHPSVMMRRESLLAVGGYRDVPWPEDYDLWLRFHAAGLAMAKLPRVLLEWRHRDGRATFSDERYSPLRFFDAKAPFLAPLLLRWGRPVWMWGAGPTGKRLARALELSGLRCAAFVDIDPRKLGGVARGVPIVASSELRRGEVSVVASVGSLGARDLIRAALAERGFVEGEDFVCAA